MTAQNRIEHTNEDSHRTDYAVFVNDELVAEHVFTLREAVKIFKNAIKQYRESDSLRTEYISAWTRNDIEAIDAETRHFEEVENEN